MVRVKTSYCEDIISKYLLNRKDLFELFKNSVLGSVPDIPIKELEIIFDRAYINFKSEFREAIDEIDIYQLEGKIKKYYYGILVKHLELCLLSNKIIMTHNVEDLTSTFKEKLEIC